MTSLCINRVSIFSNEIELKRTFPFNFHVEMGMELRIYHASCRLMSPSAVLTPTWMSGYCQAELSQYLRPLHRTETILGQSLADIADPDQTAPKD